LNHFLDFYFFSILLVHLYFTFKFGACFYFSF